MTKSTITRERMEEIRDCCWMDDLGLSMDELSELARMALAAMDSSESVELPLDYLQGHKDGLEWAAQLAEANHPERGDWLYDDLIELAKAIRKGPDMPPVQPVADSEPVAEITEDLGRSFVKIHYPTTLRAGDKLYRHAQPAPVVPDEVTAEDCPALVKYDVTEVDKAWARGFNACRSAMLRAVNHTEQHLEMVDNSGDINEMAHAALTNEGTIQAVNSPVIPDGYVMVPKDLLSELRDWAHPEIEKYCEMWAGRRDDEFPALRKVIADADALLAAAQQSPGSEPATFPGKWIPVSERLPLTHYADCEYSDIEVNVFDGERVFTAHYATGSQPQPWGEWEDTYAKITHWQPLTAAQQEDKP